MKKSTAATEAAKATFPNLRMLNDPSSKLELHKIRVSDPCVCTVGSKELGFLGQGNFEFFLRQEENDGQKEEAKEDSMV